MGSLQRLAQMMLCQFKTNAQLTAMIFSTGKSAVQNAQFNFLIPEAHCNFRNELFDSVEAHGNCGTTFSYQVKLNLTSAIDISQHNANTANITFEMEQN